MKKQLTKERVLELAIGQIDSLDLWGRKDDANERLHYICGVIELSQAVIEELEGDKE